MLNKSGLVLALIGARNIIGGIKLEEAGWLQRDVHDLNRHDREIYFKSAHFTAVLRGWVITFRSSNVRDTEGVPKDNILVLDRFLAVCPDCHAEVIPALVGKFASTPELPIVILCHPDWPRGKNTPSVVEGLWAHHEHLAGGCMEPVRNWLARDGIDVVGVDNPVCPGLAHVQVIPARLGNFGSLDPKGTSKGIEIRLAADGHDVIIHDSILYSIQGCVDSQIEQVLVVRSQHARSDYGAPRRICVLADRHC